MNAWRHLLVVGHATCCIRDCPTFTGDDVDELVPFLDNAIGEGG